MYNFADNAEMTQQVKTIARKLCNRCSLVKSYHLGISYAQASGSAYKFGFATSHWAFPVLSGLELITQIQMDSVCSSYSDKMSV